MNNSSAIPQQQISTGTNPGRNIKYITDVKTALGPLDRKIRILSFGCSMGEECVNMADIFPDATVFGCDVNEKAIATATERCAGRATILPSRTDVLLSHGPFDVIMAMNVFCRYPQTRGVHNLSKLYPFELFDTALRQLDQLVIPNGILAIFNAQYFFEDSTIFPGYDPVPLEGLISTSSGFIEKHLPSGERALVTCRKFEGQRFADDAAWGRFTQSPEGRARFVANYQKVITRQRWVKPEFAENRSLSHTLWRKKIPSPASPG